MSEDLFRFAQPAAAALALLLTATAPAAAGPFNAPGGVATPSVPNTHFVKLKQISGFTGNLAFGYSDGAYTPVGNSFNKLIKLRFTVDCPADYRVHEAGIRVRGADVHNYDVELVSPGDVPVNQNHWESALEEEPWDFDAVKAEGIAALQAANNNGPVYVSLNEKLDSRTEFYGSCAPSQPSSGLPFLYYDSAQDNGHLKPMTRVRYTLQHSIVKQPGVALQQAPLRSGTRQAAGTPGVVSVMTLPGGCPYDCPPPPPRRPKPAR